MSWYDDDWDYRAVIMVDNASSPAATADVEFDLDATHGHFWDNVDSAGADVRVSDPNGTTQVDYQLSAWNYSARTATIQLDNVTLSSSVSGVYPFRLYYGNDAASDDQSSFTASSPVTGIVAQRDPRKNAGERIIEAVTEPAGATAPSQTVVKTSFEALLIWVDVTRFLMRFEAPVEGHLRYDEIAYVTMDVETGGASQAAMYDEEEIEVYETEFGSDGGQVWLGFPVEQGSDGTDYTVLMQFGVKNRSSGTAYKHHEIRCLLRVQDPDDT